VPRNHHVPQCRITPACTSTPSARVARAPAQDEHSARTHARTHAHNLGSVGSGLRAVGSGQQNLGKGRDAILDGKHNHAHSSAEHGRHRPVQHLGHDQPKEHHHDERRYHHLCLPPRSARQDARVKTRSSRRPVRSYASAAPRHIYATRSRLLSPSARDSLSPGASLGARGTGSVGRVVGQGHVGA
jgi:hypothetical protein